MHEVQTNLQNATDLDDDALLEAVVSGWEVVCKENAEQQDLVTESQFEQWITFRNETSLKMHEIIDFSDGPISEADRRYLESVAHMIVSATHKTEQQIKDEAEKEAERQRTLADEKERRDNDVTLLETAETAVSTEVRKQGLLGRLKKLFGK